MKKSERLGLALAEFAAMPYAQDAQRAMAQLSTALRNIEIRHSGLPGYEVTHGYHGKQLHLFPYHAESPFWQINSDIGALVCQLTSHYAVFWADGGVAIFTRDGDVGGNRIFSKGEVGSQTSEVLLWGKTSRLGNPAPGG